MEARDGGIASEGSVVAVQGEARVGKEGEGGSSAPVRDLSRRRWSRGGRL